MTAAESSAPGSRAEGLGHEPILSPRSTAETVIWGGDSGAKVGKSAWGYGQQASSRKPGPWDSSPVKWAGSEQQTSHAMVS